MTIQCPNLSMSNLVIETFRHFFDFGFLISDFVIILAIADLALFNSDGAKW